MALKMTKILLLMILANIGLPTFAMNLMSRTCNKRFADLDGVERSDIEEAKAVFDAFQLWEAYFNRVDHLPPKPVWEEINARRGARRFRLSLSDPSRVLPDGAYQEEKALAERIRLTVYRLNHNPSLPAHRTLAIRVKDYLDHTGVFAEVKENGKQVDVVVAPLSEKQWRRKMAAEFGAESLQGVTRPDLVV
jgi:hypothetical protein